MMPVVPILDHHRQFCLVDDFLTGQFGMQLLENIVEAPDVDLRKVLASLRAELDPLLLEEFDVCDARVKSCCDDLLSCSAALQENHPSLLLHSRQTLWEQDEMIENHERLESSVVVVDTEYSCLCDLYNASLSTRDEAWAQGISYESVAVQLVQILLSCGQGRHSPRRNIIDNSRIRRSFLRHTLFNEYLQGCLVQGIKYPYLRHSLCSEDVPKNRRIGAKYWKPDSDMWCTENSAGAPPYPWVALIAAPHACMDPFFGLLSFELFDSTQDVFADPLHRSTLLTDIQSPLLSSFKNLPCDLELWTIVEKCRDLRLSVSHRSMFRILSGIFVVPNHVSCELIQRSEGTYDIQTPYEEEATVLPVVAIRYPTHSWYIYRDCFEMLRCEGFLECLQELCMPTTMLRTMEVTDEGIEIKEEEKEEEEEEEEEDVKVDVESHLPTLSSSFFVLSDRWCGYPETCSRLFQDIFIPRTKSHVPPFSSTPIHWTGNPHHHGRRSVLLTNETNNPMREWVQYWTELDRMFRNHEEPWILQMDIPAHLVEAALRHHVPRLTQILRLKPEERRGKYLPGRVYLECVMYNMVQKGTELREG
jgi:hypothetical protein